MVMRGEGETSQEAAVVFDAAFNSPHRLQARVILLDWLETIRRVVLFERGAAAIEELRCLDLVTKELLVALRVVTGVGPFDDWSFDETLEWMTGSSNALCAEVCQEAISFAARDVKRLLPRP